MKSIRIHVYEYIERKFADNLLHGNIKQKHIGRFLPKSWR